MSQAKTVRRLNGFTLIELMVVVSLIAIIIALAAPSFNRFIAIQRLKGINANLVTDIQLARGESASRNQYVVMRFENGGSERTCYVIFQSQSKNGCSCNTATGASSCAPGNVEIRTGHVDRILSITLGIPESQSISTIIFDPATGRIQVPESDSWVDPSGPFLIDVANPAVGTLRTSLPVTGRPAVCSPSGLISGVPECAS